MRALGRYTVDALLAVGILAPIVLFVFLEPSDNDFARILVYVAGGVGVCLSLFLAFALLTRVERILGFSAYLVVFAVMGSFVGSFALIYYWYAASAEPPQLYFTQPLNRSAAVYLTLGVLTTGSSIEPVSEGARWIASAQMFLGFVLIIGLISGVLAMAGQGIARRSGSGRADERGPSSH